MLFHDVLSRLIEAKGFRASEICEGTGIKKSYLSKLRKGTLFPSSWSVIHKIACFLELSDDEYERLCCTFKSECLSPEIQAAEQAFEQLCRPKYTLTPAAAGGDAPDLQNGTVLQKAAVIPALQKMLCGTEAVRILDIPANPEIRTAVFQALAAAPHIQIRLLLCLNSKDISAENLQTAADVLPLQFHADCEVRILHLPANGHLRCAPFPLMISADDRLLLLNGSGTEGQYLHGDSAKPYLHAFDRQYEAASSGMAVYHQPTDFLQNWQRWLAPQNGEDSSVMYVICKSPGIILEATQQDVRDHINNEFSSEQLVVLFNQMMRNLVLSPCKMVTLFWREGVSELLHAPEYYEYGKILSKTLSLNRRLVLFRKAIDNTKYSNLTDYGLFLPPYRKSQVFGVNLWSDGRMLFIFEDGADLHISVFRDKSIVNTILAWIAALKSCGMITGKEEAVQYCEQELLQTLAHAPTENGST